MLSLIFVIVCDLFEWKRICLIIGFVTRLPRRVQLVEQELLTLPEHLSSPPVFSGVRFTRCLVLCVCFVDRCLSFCPISFSHYIICPSSIYASDYSFGIFKLNTTMFDWWSSTKEKYYILLHIPTVIIYLLISCHVLVHIWLWLSRWYLQTLLSYRLF